MYALIVEPQPRRAALFVAAAEAEGLDPALAASDDEARRLLAVRGPPRLCILELTVANVDGFRLLAELRSLESPVPGIVVSAFSELRASAWSRRANFNIAAVLSTNLDIATVRSAILTALGGGRSARPPFPPDPRIADERRRRLDAAGIFGAPSPSEAVVALMARVSASFGVDTAFCAIHTGHDELAVAHAGPADALRHGTRTPREAGLVRHFVDAVSNEALVVRDALDHPTFGDHPLVAEGSVRGFAGFPLHTADGTLLGALGLLHSAPLELTMADVNQLHALARRVAGELELARQAAHPQDERARFALGHLSRIVEHLDQPVALFTATGELRLANPALARLLGRPAPELVQLRLHDVADLLTELTEDATFLQQFRHRPPDPALYDEEVQFSGEPPRTWRWRSKPVSLPEGMGALDTWLDITAERELARAALTDSLTGLPNRRGGEGACRRELARASRQRTPLCFLVVDIDHFKRVNDQFGHATGDTVIRGVGALLLACLRTSDHAARWGGEEFLAILPDTNLAGSRVIAERFRASVASASLHADLAVTVSVGTSQWDPGERAESAIGRADQALYAAKNGGRNRVA